MCIDCIDISFVQMSKDFLIGLIILLSGALITLLIHSFLGMFLELCENIADIKNSLSGESAKATAVYKPSSSINPKQSFWICAYCKAQNSNVSDKCEKCGKQRYSTWACARCGTENESINESCKFCGKMRNS